MQYLGIVSSDEFLASSPSISIPKSPANGRGFLHQKFLSPPRHSSGLGFANIISPSGSGFSNGDIFEENASSSVMEPFNDDLFSKSWTSHSVGNRETRTRTFTQTSAGGFSNQNLGLTSLVPLDENIGF